MLTGVISGSVPERLLGTSPCSLVGPFGHRLLGVRLLQPTRTVASSVAGGDILLGGVPWSFLGTGTFRLTYPNFGQLVVALGHLVDLLEALLTATSSWMGLSPSGSLGSAFSVSSIFSEPGLSG